MNQVIYIKGYWYAFVNGKLYGEYNCREYALAGLATEIKRAEKKNREK